MPVSKKSATCELSQVLKPLVNSTLLLKRCDPSHFFRYVDNQAVVARSQIRAVRRAVTQLPVEMLQQCSSASSCMRTRIVMKGHYNVRRKNNKKLNKQNIKFDNLHCDEFAQSTAR
jgi:hypothetical protein